MAGRKSLDGEDGAVVDVDVEVEEEVEFNLKVSAVLGEAPKCQAVFRVSGLLSVLIGLTRVCVMLSVTQLRASLLASLIADLDSCLLEYLW